MQSNFMEFEFGKLHYQDSMSDQKNAILFLHAVNSSSTSYLQVCHLLKEQFNLICLDFPGHGLSEHVNIDKYSWYYSMDGFTSLVIEFVNRLQLKNLFLVGDSIGGNITVRTIPSLKILEGLILMGTAQSKTPEELFSLHYSTAPLHLVLQKDLTQSECETLAVAYVDPCKNEQKNFKLMLYDIKHTAPNYREQLAQYIKTQAWVDERQLIQNCKLPLIYILGMQDGFYNSPYYKQELLEAGLQEWQIHLLDQVRHVPQLDNPDLCAKLILEFINKK